MRQIQVADFVVPFRTISDQEVQNARDVLARVGKASSNEDMTSEGLAKGEGPVARFFAEQLLDFHKNHSGKERTFKLVSLQLGDQVVMATVPGEAFTEVGLAIKAASPFKVNFIISLAMGCCGYIPLPECFFRGGYEILPVQNGGPREDTAPRLVEAVKRLIG